MSNGELSVSGGRFMVRPAEPFEALKKILVAAERTYPANLKIIREVFLKKLGIELDEQTARKLLRREYLGLPLIAAIRQAYQAKSGKVISETQARDELHNFITANVPLKPWPQMVVEFLGETGDTGGSHGLLKVCYEVLEAVRHNGEELMCDGSLDRARRKLRNRANLRIDNLDGDKRWVFRVRMAHKRSPAGIESDLRTIGSLAVDTITLNPITYDGQGTQECRYADGRVRLVPVEPTYAELSVRSELNLAWLFTYELV
jgi:hypothetical protein